ncbi:MAG: glycosyltransferase family 9 protein [Flavobacteriales bacterium]
MKKAPEHIIISRTDGIGDVVLTLPLVGALKVLFPKVKISFLGRSYTKSIIDACVHVDHFMDWDEIEKSNPSKAMEESGADVIFHVFPRPEILVAAKAAKIPFRIGTARRWTAVRTINKPLFYSRKNSDLHEAQLNLRMLEGLGIKRGYTLDGIAKMFGLRAPRLADNYFRKIKGKRIVVLHPMSHGSALEWPLKKFSDLTELLVKANYTVAITGTAKEGESMRKELPWHLPGVLDFTGSLDLGQLLALLNKAVGIVAASTGPLHMAAAVGTPALGLYSPKRPIFPTRWAPIGRYTDFLECEVHPTSGQLPFHAEEVFNRLEELLSEVGKKD